MYTSLDLIVVPSELMLLFIGILHGIFSIGAIVPFACYSASAVTQDNIGIKSNIKNNN